MQIESLDVSKRFLSGGGEMGNLIRTRDWSNTPVGNIELWPQSLLTTISILLSSKFPMFLWWGPDLIQFYNDSYSPSFGNEGRHPHALGQKGVDCWQDIWHIIKPLIDQVLQGGESVWMEDQLIPIYRNGKLEDVYWTFSYSPVRDETGNINGVLVVCNETTEKVIAYKATEESERRFRDTIRQAPVAICILRGRKQIIETANDKMLELWGKTAEQVINKDLFEAVPEVAGQGYEEILDDVFTTGETYIGHDAPVRLARGSKVINAYVNFTYEPLREADGTISGVTVVANEVTKQVEIRSALVQSENKFRTLIVQSTVAMAVYKGKDFVIDIVNQSMLKNFWRKELHEVRGKKLLDVFPELIGQRFPVLLTQVLDTGKPYNETEAAVDVDLPGGRKKLFFDFEYAPVIELDRTISGIIFTIDDVTEKVEARQQIKDAVERLQLATEGTQLATWDLNLETRTLIYSPRLATIFGHSENKQLTHQDLLNQIHPDDLRSIVEKAFAAALKTGVYYYEARIVHPDDTLHWIKTQGKVVYDKTHPMRMLGTMIDITEQKKIEDELLKMAAIVQSSEDAIISKGLDGIIKSWNDAAQRIFGYTAEEMIGQFISKIIPADRQDEEPQIISRLKKGERVEHFETQRLTKNNGLVDISLTISPIKDSLGNIIGASKIARDISSQKNSKRLISESEERLQIVVDASDLGTWEMNLITSEFTYSRRHKEILGYKEDESPTHPQLLTQLHPEDIHIRERAFKEALKSGVLHYVSRVIWKDNSIHWVEARGKVFYNSKNEPLKMVGTARDITDEKLHQQELKENEQKFRLLADSMPQFVWIGNADGHLNYFNQSVYNYTGLTVEQIGQEGWLQIVHPDDREENERSWMESVRSGEPFHFEHRFRRSDGEYRWQLSRAVPQRDAQGKIQMWVGTSTDIHDRKIVTDKLENEVQERTRELNQANEDLVKSNNELAQFAYVASHDLQEPLRKIQAFSTRLLEFEVNNLSDKGKDYFNRMQLASKRMQQLIVDLLSYSRANTTEKHFESTNLKMILKIVKEQLKELIEQKQAVIKSSTLPVIDIIPYQFEQLLTNIISNALKFSKENVHPVIEINSEIVNGKTIGHPAATKARYHHLSIKDNGIGFDPKFSERIFQVFQRLHGKDEYPGTGIGLAIVKRIVDNHGGIVNATSEPGNGSVFNIYLPISEGAPV